MRGLGAPAHGTRPSFPLLIDEDQKVGRNWTSPELPQQRRHLASMVRGVIHDVLQHLP
jgi:hypothetical protein